ncbi:hypothetical protein SK128_003628 [Halocaridina rubra]|uniref:Uncharacterized protein n=1 Tax=Halocaridina rubra TaxID=373956 RepID=A0AAN9A787_HALRR
MISPNLRTLEDIKEADKKSHRSGCRRMFNIGIQTNGHNGYYDKYRSLPSLLRKMNDTTLNMLSRSRLQITGGSLPYIDCDIKLYTSSDIKQCISRRQHLSHAPWIAFVGDSKMRVKFNRFVSTNVNFNWRIYNASSEQATSTSWKSYFLRNPKKYQHSLSVQGYRGTRLDFIWATKGLTTHRGFDVPEPQLKKWAYEAKRVPDVVIVGFGMWTMHEEFLLRLPSLRSVSSIAELWLNVAQVLEDLATRTTVIAWCQTRTREIAAIDYVTEEAINLSFAERLKRILHYSRTHSWASEWIDEVMHMALGYTKGVIIWDTTVPFSLANIKECKDMHAVGHSNHTAYCSPPHLCCDFVHNDLLTLDDENTMILNLLCNKFTSGNKNYCCSQHFHLNQDM